MLRRDVACADANVPAVAILRDEREVDRPSNDAALQKFIEAAPQVGLRAELVGPDALERLSNSTGSSSVRRPMSATTRTNSPGAQPRSVCP